MSTPTATDALPRPAAQPPSRAPGRRRVRLAALAGAVGLGHALLLDAWTRAPSSPAAAALQVRQIVQTAPVRAGAAAMTVAAPRAEAAVAPIAGAPIAVAPADATGITAAGGVATAASPEPATPPRDAPPGLPADAFESVETTAAAPAGVVEIAAETAADLAAALAAPTYDTDLPPAMLLRYALQRGGREGEATLRWQRDGARYELEMNGRIAGLERFGWASRGGFDAGGLAPERFVVRRRGRDAAAVNFGREASAGRSPTAAPAITFSGPSFALPQPAGVQDRVSWIIQFAAVVRALPTPVTAGTAVAMPVVGPRGDLVLWRFVAAAPEPLDVPAGPVAAAQAWHRAGERARDLDVRIWLDPARGQLPVRLRLEAQPDGGSTEWRLAALQPG